MSRVAEKRALAARLAELETQLAQGRAQALAAIDKKSAALREELKEPAPRQELKQPASDCCRACKSPATEMGGHAARTRLTCRFFPACRQGSSCPYLHPEVPCRFGAECTREDCMYVHSFEDGISAPMAVTRLLTLLVGQAERSAEGTPWIRLSDWTRVARNWRIGEALGRRSGKLSPEQLLACVSLEPGSRPRVGSLSIFKLRPGKRNEGITEKANPRLIGFPPPYAYALEPSTIDRNIALGKAQLLSRRAEKEPSTSLGPPVSISKKRPDSGEATLSSLMRRPIGYAAKESAKAANKVAKPAEPAKKVEKKATKQAAASISFVPGEVMGTASASTLEQGDAEEDEEGEGEGGGEEEGGLDSSVWQQQLDTFLVEARSQMTPMRREPAIPGGTITSGIGFELLMQMGWRRGAGLGQRQQGESEPLAQKLPMQMSKKGLGFQPKPGPLSQSKRKEEKKPKAAAALQKKVAGGVKKKKRKKSKPAPMTTRAQKKANQEWAAKKRAKSAAPVAAASTSAPAHAQSVPSKRKAEQLEPTAATLSGQAAPKKAAEVSAWTTKRVCTTCGCELRPGGHTECIGCRLGCKQDVLSKLSKR